MRMDLQMLGSFGGKIAVIFLVGTLSFVAMPACKSTNSAAAVELSETKETKLAPKGPLVHAHRGGRNEGRENSSAQMLRAIDLGVDALEFDVVGSKDGVLFVKHDQFVEVECGLEKRKYLRTMTSSEILKLNCTDKKNNTFYKIETLDAVLEAIAKKLSKTNLPNLKLNIETKISEVKDPENPADPNYAKVSEELVKKEVEGILSSLKKHKLTDRAIIQSFDIRSLIEAKKLSPTIPRSRLFLPTGYSFRLGEHLVSQVSRELNDHPQLYSIVSPWGLKQTSYGLFLAQLVDESSVKTLKEWKLQVIPWTINDPKDWERLMGYGVDAIITDEPSKFLEWRKNLP